MRVEKFKNARESKSSIFMKFTRKYKENTNGYFCFFEGEDFKYYGIRLKQYMPSKLKIIPFDCKGKDTVLRVKELILKKEGYVNAYKSFFVDRDFDPEVKCKSNLLYETPFYSIENFYVQKEVIEEILISEFKLDSLSEDYSNCIKLFINRQKEFHRSIILLNAWIACQRDLRIKGIKTQVHLNNIRLDRLVTISLEGVVQNYDIDKIEKLFPDAKKIPQETLENKLKYFKTLVPENRFRGKFEIEFLRKFFELLLTDQNSRHPKYFSKKKRNGLQLTSKNIISELSQYAITHDSLKDFLNNLFSNRERFTELSIK